MSIPEFFDMYHLPPGEHEATLDEVCERFGNSSDSRKKVWTCFSYLLQRLEQLKIKPDIIYIDGSFVTGRVEPGDVDCAVLIKPGKFLRALKEADVHDKRAIQMFCNTMQQETIRDVLGAHCLIADNETALDQYTNLFKHGMPGEGLRDPDKKRDPDWVQKPKQKGIIKIIEKKDDKAIDNPLNGGSV